MRKLILSFLLFVSVSSPAELAIDKTLAKRQAALFQEAIDTLSKAHVEFQKEFKNRKLKPSDIELLKELDAQTKALNELLAKQLGN